MAKELKNGNTPAEGANSLNSTIARVVRLLEYLRENTDSDNSVSQAKLLEAGGEDHDFGAKSTLKNTLVALARALNTDKYGILKPKEDRRLMFKAKGLSDGEIGDNDPDGLTKVYYNHIFTNAEITTIINALHTSKAVSKADAEAISKKLTKNLAQKDYKRPAYTLDFSEPIDSMPGIDPAQLSENIAEIQKAISEGYRITFGYNRVYSQLLNPGNHEPYDKVIHSVSPCYIVSQNGLLFLYGGNKDGKLSSYRVDMMKKIRHSGRSKIKSLEKHEITGMPDKMTDDFKVRHLNGSYGNDYISVQFEWSCRDEITKELICTALYGAFGNTFEIDKNGIVTVKTSKFGMKIFALQYADYVRVLKTDITKDLVEDIAKTVCGLRDKYL